MKDATALLLQQGKLETTCPVCGRHEAAGAYCSWCFRRSTPADWYRNGDTAAHLARLPKTAPANPPIEYRRAIREEGGSWPSQWGPSPYAKKPAQPVAEAPNSVEDASSGAGVQEALW